MVKRVKSKIFNLLDVSWELNNIIPEESVLYKRIYLNTYFNIIFFLLKRQLF